MTAITGLQRRSHAGDGSARASLRVPNYNRENNADQGNEASELRPDNPPIGLPTTMRPRGWQALAERRIWQARNSGCYAGIVERKSQRYDYTQSDDSQRPRGVQYADPKGC